MRRALRNPVLSAKDEDYLLLLAPLQCFRKTWQKPRGAGRVAIRWAGGYSRLWDGTSLPLAFPPLFLPVLGYQHPSCEPLVLSTCGRAQLKFQKCLKFIPFPQVVLGLLKPTSLQVCPAGYELSPALRRQEAGLGYAQ